MFKKHIPLIVGLALGIGCMPFLTNIYAENRGTQTSGSIQKFESVAYPGYYIRHQYGKGRLDSFITPYQDAEWRVVPGLANASDPALISLEASNYPGCYLRHKDGFLYLEKMEEKPLFRSDATFRVGPGLSDPTKISLQACNYPGYYIRINDETSRQLKILPVSSVADRQEATFFRRAFNWLWVKGAVFVPTNAVNQIQQWDEYDPVINDRELYYTSVYGINTVRIFLHYLVWEKDKYRLLHNLEDFLSRADKYGIKTEIVFFDDCWNPNPACGTPYPDPVFGVHNSRWVQSPGNHVKENYEAYKSRLKAYVQDVVNAHKNDDRIIFWELYNEPGNAMHGLYYEITNRILVDSKAWIKETRTPIPITATDFAGTVAPAVSDFFSWHIYGKYDSPPNPSSTLNTETMNRAGQTIPGVINYFKEKTGFVIWEAGIGRDNCRYPWGDTKKEPAIPFHGIFYPDGHPWSMNDVKALRGDELSDAPLFDVEYFADTNFKHKKKTSVTPSIDFDLGNEFGTGSPDTSAGIGTDNFSIRWTGFIAPRTTDTYTFSADTDNIARLWVDGKLIIDKKDNNRNEVQGQVQLEAGKSYSFQAEYIHFEGDASLHIYWAAPGLDKQALPGNRTTSQTGFKP